MKTDHEIPAPPDHLSERAGGLWNSIASEYFLTDAQLELLRRACEASDRADAALEVLARDGITTTDRFGQIRAHPMVAVERDSRLAEARLLRELALAPAEPEPEEEYARPPRAGASVTGRGRR